MVKLFDLHGSSTKASEEGEEASEIGNMKVEILRNEEQRNWMIKAEESGERDGKRRKWRRVVCVRYALVVVDGRIGRCRLYLS